MTTRSGRARNVVPSRRQWGCQRHLAASCKFTSLGWILCEGHTLFQGMENRPKEGPARQYNQEGYFFNGGTMENTSTIVLGYMLGILGVTSLVINYYQIKMMKKSK